jgi:ATP-dependent RNA helicase DDX5/DBP2
MARDSGGQDRDYTASNDRWGGGYSYESETRNAQGSVEKWGNDQGGSGQGWSNDWKNEKWSNNDSNSGNWSKGNDKWSNNDLKSDKWSSDKWSKDQWTDGGSKYGNRDSWNKESWKGSDKKSWESKGNDWSGRSWGGGNSYGGRGGYSGGYSGYGGKSGNMMPQLWPVDFSSTNLVDFVKDFYIPTPSVKSRSEDECEMIRRQYGLRIVSGEDVPKVIVSFEESSFPEYLVRSLYRHFGPDAVPTPIQMQGWPVAMSGRSLVGIAQTGSGKTLAYILPAIVHINAQPPAQPGEGPIALVLVPTRELCTQISQEAEKFSKAVADVGGVPTKIACAFGGVKKSEQLWAIRDSLDILVAAPGRLIDFLASSQLTLMRTSYVVLDEADEMFSMGFLPQLTQILSQIRPDRQVLLYSATWPNEVRNLARAVCTEKPVHIQVGGDDLAANHQIDQHVMYVNSEKDKMDKLFHEVLPQLYLDENGQRLKEDAKLLVFCNTKDTVDFLTKRMREEGVPAVAIHSGKEQTERLWVFDQFRNGDTKVLVSTNLMGRGVDVPTVNIVVNYDMPKNIAEYIHRIGRTARAKALGKAISFFGTNDVPIINDLVGVLNEANQIVPEWLMEFKMNPYYRPF